MGYYYGSEPPPRKDPWWRKFVPGWLKQLWVDTEEVLMVTRVTFSIIFPVIGVLFGFMVLCLLGVTLLSLCTSKG